jgi:hypothetical protein
LQPTTRASGLWKRTRPKSCWAVRPPTSG